MNEAHNTDCLEAMRKMKDNQFELAIVDPPYGIGDTWSKSRRDRFYQEGKLHQYQNESIPSSEYFKELLRVSESQVIFGGNYYTEYLRPTNSWIVWDKERNADLTFMSEAELAWTSHKKVCRIARFIWDGGKKGKETGIKKCHPHQKPIALYSWILKNYAKEGDTILDTHLGSGSSRIACHQMGFDFVGYEIDKDYFDASEKRFQHAIQQQSMFNPTEMY